MFLLTFDACDELAATAARASLVAYLEREVDGNDDLLPVEEVFSELVGNVCRHGQRRATVGITWRRDGSPMLEVVDRGPGLDMTQWKPPDQFSEHGRGLFIVTHLCRDLVVAPGPDGIGTRVRAVLPLRRRLNVA